MIAIKDKENCCGCGACSNVCPKSCIRLQEDEEGFLYPIADSLLCINCGKCEKVCPVSNPSEAKASEAVFAAKNVSDEARMKSSSGGAFVKLAEMVLQEGGVVFGACFDNHFEVEHSYVEETSSLGKLLGSKYVQSKMGDCFQKVKQFLEIGRKVLFSGTPCQVAGLKSFLGHEFENLIAVDIVCHGVPSPLVWRKYLESLGARDISSVSFRNKRDGWTKYRIRICDAIEQKEVVDECYLDNVFMKGFLKNFYLRPSCYKCPAKGGRSCSDITIGDYWGVEKQHPAFFDEKGVSLVLANTEKGLLMIKNSSLLLVESSYSQATQRNACIEKSVFRSPDRDYFWKQFPKQGIGAIERTISHASKPNLFRFIAKRLNKQS
ncbi:MAG: Coenzyme F420 hydrogenase/dehydrogenase, beta subunit C-terminal domain [Bacteroidaceae bacterium]|nr:Coenzyme F420 hydrogenase/dehydrogenase, beta subunit C-terminal domain [Bacteroidaceae bacterium]